MKPQVAITSRAERQIERAYGWYQVRDSASAERWFSALLEIFDQVCRYPENYRLIDESGRFPAELRQATFEAGRKATHRCVFAVRPEGIVIYAVRHLAQDEIDPESWDLTDEENAV